MTERIRIGVIGLRFGSQVHVPAFRSDPRCEVIALAGRDSTKAAAIARELDLAAPFADWHDLVAAPDIDAVSIAVPPASQAAIVAEAARNRKHVFCEKPLAASLTDAREALGSVEAAGIVHGIDFIFPEISHWQQAKEMIAQGTIGRPVHFAYTWRVETYASRTNADTWKNRPEEGGGVLGNFASHVFHNIEWLLGDIEAIESIVSPGGARRGRAVDGIVRLAHDCWGSLSISADAFLGTGHLVEVYGDEGALVLHNPTNDYVLGFRLSLGTRASGALACVSSDERATPSSDGRLAPVSRLVWRFIDAIRDTGAMSPNLAHGVRVQELLALAEAATQPVQRLPLHRTAITS